MSFHLPEVPLTEAGWLFALLFTLVLIVPVASARLRLPMVVGFVLTGMLIGPGVSGLLEREGGVELLGTAGLLYLMFIAGLELDLDEFIEHRQASLAFGVSSFLAPMVIGTVAMLALGFDPLPAVLLASCWASHTLVAYPEYQRYGTARNRAVSVTVGATILTDTAALLVLAVVAGIHRGEIGPAFWLTLVPSIVVLLGFTLWVLPVLGRRFFSGLGQDTSIRFVFVIAVVFAIAGLAELAGIEGIVGAFLAGLAMNRLVPHGSPLMERLEFFGDQFMIPLFLLSVGLLIDPRILLDPQALLLGGAFIVVAIVAKLVAAVGTGKLFGYDGPEIGSMFALSSAQAAATLAAILVGVNVGLIDERTLNAVIAVIAFTCLLSSWLGSRYARQLPAPPARAEVGAAVVVPVARPESTRALVKLAAAMARPDSGCVVPITVATGPVDQETLQRVTDAKDEATSMALSHGVEASGVVRIDATPDVGISHTVIEQRASLMVVGWKGATTRRSALFGDILDSIVAHVDVPTIIGRLDDEPFERIVLAIPTATLAPAARGAATLAVEAVRRLRIENPVPVLALAEQHHEQLAESARTVLDADYEALAEPMPEALQRLTRPGDLVVLPVTRSIGRVPVLGARIAQSLPAIPLLIVMDGAARTVGELAHDRIGTEHPFGPPPWTRTG
jgi:Kef-type K+ transport system membrane component KefB